MKNLVIFVSVFLLIGCAAQPPQAYYAISENARQGGLEFTAVNGEAIENKDGSYIDAGVHEFSVICRMPNGIGSSFAFSVELKAETSYCFFSGNQGNTCQIMHSEAPWQADKVVICN